MQGYGLHVHCCLKADEGHEYCPTIDLHIVRVRVRMSG